LSDVTNIVRHVTNIVRHVTNIVKYNFVFMFGIYSLSFIVAPSMAALSHSRPASSRTPRDSCGATDSGKTNAL